MNFPVVFKCNSVKQYTDKWTFKQDVRKIIPGGISQEVIAVLLNTANDACREGILRDMVEHNFEVYNRIDGINMTIQKDKIIINNLDETYKLFPAYANFIDVPINSLLPLEKIALQAALNNDTIDLLKKGLKHRAASQINRFVRGLQLEESRNYLIALTARYVVKFIETYAVY